jgi:hypothetical protein
LPGKLSKTTGCNIFAQSALAYAHAKSCYAPPAAQGLLVLLNFTRSLSADTFGINQHSGIVGNQKEAVACQGARPGVWPCEVAAIVLTLSFGYFWIKPKVTALPAAIERVDAGIKVCCHLKDQN